MKINIRVIIVSALGLLVPQVIIAQGTTYVSSLSQAATDGLSVGSDSWLAVIFRSGGNGTGYQLNSVQLSMTDASGNPNDLTVMIYTVIGVFGPDPGSSLGTLNGSANPSTAGIYTYTTGSNITLSPSTDYFVVLTAATTVANGFYNWNVSSTYSPISIGGWSGDNILAQSINGSNWNYITGNYPLFAINATAVPEPSALGLLAFGATALFVRRQLNCQ